VRWVFESWKISYFSLRLGFSKGFFPFLRDKLGDKVGDFGFYQGFWRFLRLFLLGFNGVLLQWIYL